MKLSFLFLLSLAAVVCSAGPASAPTRTAALPQLSSVDREDIVSALTLYSYHFNEFSGLFPEDHDVLKAKADAYAAAAQFVRDYKATTTAANSRR